MVLQPGCEGERGCGDWTVLQPGCESERGCGWWRGVAECEGGGSVQGRGHHGGGGGLRPRPCMGGTGGTRGAPPEQYSSCSVCARASQCVSAASLPPVILINSNMSQPLNISQHFSPSTCWVVEFASFSSVRRVGSQWGAQNMAMSPKKWWKRFLGSLGAVLGSAAMQ